MFSEFMVELFYSRARRGNRCIVVYLTVCGTPLLDKAVDQNAANLTARRIEAETVTQNKADYF
jgi:hypothetical protein